MTVFRSPQEIENHKQNARVKYLDYLYALDGRQDPKHEFHAVYTGLFKKYGKNYVG